VGVRRGEGRGEREKGRGERVTYRPPKKGHPLLRNFVFIPNNACLIFPRMGHRRKFQRIGQNFGSEIFNTEDLKIRRGRFVLPEK
jgi:hypothetical protein